MVHDNAEQFVPKLQTQVQLVAIISRPCCNNEHNTAHYKNPSFETKFVPEHRDSPQCQCDPYDVTLLTSSPQTNAVK
jgi:hypothetical protein